MAFSGGPVVANFLSEEKKASAEKSWEKERDRQKERKKERESSKGVKGESDFQSTGASGRLFAMEPRVCSTSSVYKTLVVCAAGEEEINKHIKLRDSFTPDKNMSRDTYLDPLLLIAPACSRSPPPSRSLSFSVLFSSLAVKCSLERCGAHELDDCINYV